MTCVVLCALAFLAWCISIVVVLAVVAVLIVMGALIAMGYWLRGGVERERAEARRPRCPRCDAPLGPPRPLDRGRR